MTDQDQLKNQIESIFKKYKFSEEQSSEAIIDLIQIGEPMVFASLAKGMDSNKKIDFEQKLTSKENSDDKMKNIYTFLAENCDNTKLNEVRNSVYNQLINDYIAHMNK